MLKVKAQCVLNYRTIPALAHTGSYDVIDALLWVAGDCSSNPCQNGAECFIRNAGGYDCVCNNPDPNNPYYEGKQQRFHLLG